MCAPRDQIKSSGNQFEQTDLNALQSAGANFFVPWDLVRQIGDRSIHALPNSATKGDISPISTRAGNKLPRIVSSVLICRSLILLTLKILGRHLAPILLLFVTHLRALIEGAQAALSTAEICKALTLALSLHFSRTSSSGEQPKTAASEISGTLAWAHGQSV
jgi:hypothetical protein